MISQRFVNVSDVIRLKPCWIERSGACLSFPQSPLIRGEIRPSDRRNRLFLFVAWLALVAWLLSVHTFWRDEVRAFSFALSGTTISGMLRNTHGEGHPALWYLILRIGHDLFPCREVLPVAGAVIGIAAAAVVAAFAPFRTAIVGLILFSFYGAFEYVVVARNYGMAMLVMFVLAALYPRVRNSLWLGVLLAILCNTNVPSCLLAAMFLLFRFIEMLTEEKRLTRRDWTIFAGNALLSLVGALLCFTMIYPTFNDAAVSANYGFSIGRILSGLADASSGFTNIGMGVILLALSCLGLIRSPAAMGAALAGLISLKLFFYLVYPSSYRHEALFITFLVALYWMVADGAGGLWRWSRRRTDLIQRGGTLFFVALLAVQTVQLYVPLKNAVSGKLFSRSADAAKVLRQPELRSAIVMADPDTMLEALPYYADNPLWFLRQQHFGKVARLTNDARRLLTLDDILTDADRLHRQTGRPVVFMSHLELTPETKLRRAMMYNDETVVTPEAAKRFLGATRLVARLRPSGMDENYDLYVYPR